MINILKDLVSINTIKDKNNKEIMDYIENYLCKYNFTVERIDKCLIAYNSSKPSIGFIGHTDTVDYESWNGEPFVLQEIDNKLIGLGACDMKGGISAILYTISKIDLNKNKLALYFTYDEEISFKGINTIKDMIIPDNIIIGEPTNNIPIYGTKGLLELHIDIYGTKCHSSTPNKGKSAIKECIISETLIIYYLRTNKLHIIGSKPSKILVLTSIITICATILIPIIISSVPGFNYVILPIHYYLYVMGLGILYMIIVRIVKKIYISKYGEWL